MGRPSTFDQSTMDRICGHIAAGDSARKACELEALDEATLRDWKRIRPEVLTQYMGACEQRAYGWAEELMEVADNGRNDWMLANDRDNAGYRENGESVRRSALRVDARKWMMARILPKQFGDKVEHTGKDGGPVVFTLERVDK